MVKKDGLSLSVSSLLVNWWSAVLPLCSLCLSLLVLTAFLIRSNYPEVYFEPVLTAFERFCFWIGLLL